MWEEPRGLSKQGKRLKSVTKIKKVHAARRGRGEVQHLLVEGRRPEPRRPFPLECPAEGPGKERVQAGERQRWALALGQGVAGKEEVEPIPGTPAAGDADPQKRKLLPRLKGLPQRDPDLLQRRSDRHPPGPEMAALKDREGQEEEGVAAAALAWRPGWEGSRPPSPPSSTHWASARGQGRRLKADTSAWFRPPTADTPSG